MDDRVKKYLKDMLIAIDEIESFFENYPLKYETFADNLLLQRGIERNIEIIGEAMKRVLSSEHDIQVTNARKIVDTRNYIIHSYDSLTADILWSIVIIHLPILKQEINAILQSQ
jgi:uncharacterized protein with HEPN domain